MKHQRKQSLLQLSWCQAIMLELKAVDYWCNHHKAYHSNRRQGLPMITWTSTSGFLMSCHQDSVLWPTLGALLKWSSWSSGLSAEGVYQQHLRWANLPADNAKLGKCIMLAIWVNECICVNNCNQACSHSKLSASRGTRVNDNKTEIAGAHHRWHHRSCFRSYDVWWFMAACWRMYSYTPVRLTSLEPVGAFHLSNRHQVQLNIESAAACPSRRLLEWAVAWTGLNLQTMSVTVCKWHRSTESKHFPGTSAF